MNQSLLIRAAALYLPIILACIAGVLRCMTLRSLGEQKCDRTNRNERCDSRETSFRPQPLAYLCRVILRARTPGAPVARKCDWGKRDEGSASCDASPTAEKREESASPNTSKLFAACLLATLWVAPALLVVAKLNAIFNWWSFEPSSISFAGMPLELYLGWIVAWGILPQLVFRTVPVALCAASFVALDLVAMPLCRPVVVLHPHWLVGEMCAAAIILVPALSLARWTHDNTHLRIRALLQLVISAMLFLFLVPEIVFSLRPGPGWAPLLELPAWLRPTAFEIIFLLALPGIGAVIEFAERGEGTPIPYDPPARLVASGIYRYCANPMQLSCTLVMLAWSVLLHNAWLAIAALISFIYSAGLASWDEHQDLARRFGEDWRQYRSAVHNWRPRWRPYDSGPAARLYIAFSCGPCSELRAWLIAQNPIGLEILPAESLPAGSIRRMRYVPSDGAPSVEGIRALARALEHLNLAGAIVGIVLRLPIVRQFVQLIADVSGFGPQSIPSTCPANADASSGASLVVIDSQ